ncbi:hypothetical protein IWQ60_010111 [Tieghemiomyces parasiticus]|uniref:Uncharacterized protein n=1 Tax=Tieghemiomyces parasiticus TaxID=78921 RepID=A0A9W7ZMF7_9FUNG|nr:hypothetical protein IWQ60_010111 [Tieghemiomyces parasiticus]
MKAGVESLASSASEKTFDTLAELMRPFVRSWLLIEARLTHMRPGRLGEFCSQVTNMIELFRSIVASPRDRRWPGLIALRNDIIHHLGPKASVVGDYVRPLPHVGDVEETSNSLPTGINSWFTGLLRRQVSMLTPADLLLAPPYAVLYDLIDLFNTDDNLGQFLRLVSAKPTAQHLMEHLIGPTLPTPLFNLKRPRVLYGPSTDHRKERGAQSPYWSSDLALTLITLRMLERPAEPIEPSSELGRFLNDQGLTSTQGQWRVWALGTELGLPGMDVLFEGARFGVADYAAIAACSRSQQWTTAENRAGERLPREYQALTQCPEDAFYTASPVRLGAKRSLVVQVFTVSVPTGNSLESSEGGQLDQDQTLEQYDWDADHAMGETNIFGTWADFLGIELEE